MSSILKTHSETFQTRGRSWKITLVHGTELEHSSFEQLKHLLETYDLSKWAHTDRVQNDSSTISHSHPILTLNTRWVGRGDQILASFLHEQIHWLLSSRQDKVDAAIRDLRALYPQAPKSPPDGARDEKSTYLHLIVNYLEYQALKELLGPARATTVLEERQQVFYVWIYRKVLSDTKQIVTLFVVTGWKNKSEGPS